MRSNPIDEYVGKYVLVISFEVQRNSHDIRETYERRFEDLFHHLPERIEELTRALNGCGAKIVVRDEWWNDITYRFKK